MSKKVVTSNLILDSIRLNYDSLSESEKKVANYVSSNIDDIIHLRINELSKVANVSEPTIIRFCRKIGTSGYQDLKIRIAQEQKTDYSNLSIIHEDLSITDTIENISIKVINSHILALTQTLNQIDYNMLNNVISLIKKSNKVCFWGLGGSGTLASDAENKFLRTSINTIFSSDSHIQIIKTSLLTPQDCIIIFSNTGNTKHFVKLLELANESEVPSILITSSHNSPISRHSTYTLEIKSKEIAYKDEPSSSRIAMLALIDIIVASIALNEHDNYIKKVNKTRKALSLDKFKKEI